MGYRTMFKVTAEGADAVAAVEALAEKSGYSGYQETDHWSPGDEVKWYAWEKDASAISEIFNHTVIVIEGEGEESGDVWKAWAYRGKVEVARAIIEFPTPLWVAEALESASEALTELEAHNAAQQEAEERAIYERLHEKYGDA
jgi:hypothetical protein